MFFGRTKFNFVFIGAGSSVFTMRLAGDILKEDFIEGGEFRLVDIDEKVLEEVTAAVKKLVAHGGKPFTVKSFSHFRGALPGADFVLFTYAVGAYQAWKQDIATCTRFGVNQSVGDTIGPGAVIRILRSIPLALVIAHEMEKVCPDAWIINYTNPEGAQCLAIQKYTKINSFGLCHGTPDTARDLAEKVFGVPAAALYYEAAGVNHLTWFTRLSIEGRDVYPELRDRLAVTGYVKKEPVSSHLFRVFGLYPAPGDRHVQEFFSAFLRDNVIRQRNLAWPNNDFAVIDGWRAEGDRRVKAILEMDEGYDHFLSGSGESATHFMRALATGETATEMVNVTNRGYIENISDGVIVELPTFVNQMGLKPTHVGRLPDGIAAKCEALGREYLLLVDAAVEADILKARQAMYLDPLAAMADDPEGLLDALIEENLALLPEAWSAIVGGKAR
jgi:alpha-galactosidase